MILVTGGLGFIGLHTARHLIDLGEDVVLTQYRVAREPDFIKGEIGKHAFVEQLDVTNADQLMEIGKRHKITGIAHLAVPSYGAMTPADDFKMNMTGLLNILEAARIWEVKRLGLASSIAVYSNEPQGPFTEDMRLLPVGTNPTETWKKSFEIIGSYYGQRTGLDIVMLRIAGIYGPLYHSMMNLPSRLTHAALKGTAPEMRGGDVYEEDGTDMCYVKDCGLGIAMLMHADSLPNKVYNVSSGVETTNKQLADAIKRMVPGAQMPLKPGRSPNARKNAYLSTDRIKADVGYEPRFPIEKAIEDYVGWLRAGNPE
ncbi:MAG TPA: NAD(P)-dependent oxidoreductase [Dehalococcoidia bacterium]|nr:NAD(P)-dependent oxidoreductase [Dehalococcoidia bacterium]